MRRPSQERQIIFFTCAAHALTHVYMVVYTVVLERMGETFGRDITDFTTISTVLFGLGAIPASLLADRYGEKRLLVAFFLLTALGGTVLGLAQGTITLALGMACLGLGTSIFHPVGNAFLARGIAASGRAMGKNGMWGSFGEAFGPLLGAGIAAQFGSWRASYLILTVPMILLGLWLHRTPIEVPKEISARRAALPGSGSRQVIVFLLLAMMCGGFQFWILKTMLPTYVEKNTAESMIPATLRGGLLTSIIYVFGAFGQHLAGTLVHHREGRGLYAAIFFLSAPVIYATGRLSGLPLIAVGSLMSVLVFAAQPIENVLLARFSPPGWVGRLMGLKFTLAFGVGGLGPSLSKGVRDAYGLPSVFTAASLFTLASLGLALAAWRTGSRARDRQSPTGATAALGADR
jgi:FSR family fosmidomycin resistance protein-like MFS transporter